MGTKIYSDKDSNTEIPYDTIVCNGKISDYFNKLIGPSSDEKYYIVIGIEDNQLMSTIDSITQYNAILAYSVLIKDLFTFSTLDINGGGKAVYLSDLYNKLSLFKLKMIIDVPNNDYNFDTIVIDNQDPKYKNLTVNLKVGGFILVNVLLTGDLNIMKLKIEDGTFIYNYDNNFIGYNDDKDNNSQEFKKCTMIVNKDIKLYNQLENEVIIYKLINFGIILLHGKQTTFGNKSSDITDDIIHNYGHIRIFKNNKCDVYGSISNSGKFFIYEEMKMSSRFSNDEEGDLIIETGGKIKFDILNKSYSYEYLLSNLSGIINVKENGAIELSSEPSNKNSNYGLKYIIRNNDIVKIDGSIINHSSESRKIYNDINSIVYLENDFDIKDNVEFDNNDVIISYVDKPINLTNKGRYLNIDSMEYYKYKAKKNPIILSDDLNNIKDCLFELNSSEVQPDTLNTITYLLTTQYNIQNNNEKESDLSEIIRLIKIGLLKDLPYPPVQPLPVRPPIYPPKPKYQPCCPCYK